MKPYQPVRWPCYIWWRDELKPRRKYLLFGPRNQGERTASNYLGFLIVAKKGTPSWTIEQEKYECRYWVTHSWRLVDFFWFYKMPPRQWWDGEYAMSDVLDWRYARWKKAAAHLARVECASRAQEIRARREWYYMNKMEKWWSVRETEKTESKCRAYARSIHGAKNYPFFAAAGWTEEDCYNEIVKHL